MCKLGNSDINSNRLARIDEPEYWFANLTCNYCIPFSRLSDDSNLFDVDRLAMQNDLD
jgi:hypothetical protein